MEKRTDKIKKKTFGGFYSEFAKWNPRGKSSKEKDEMIADLKNCVSHQLARIKKHKYVIQVLKEDRDKRISMDKVRQMRSEYKRKLINEKNKVSTRDSNLDSKNEELDILEKELKTNQREIARLLRTLEKKDEVITDIKKSKRKVIYKEIEKPVSSKVKRLERMIEKATSPESITTLHTSLNLTKFSEEHKISPNLISILLQINSVPSLKFSELILGTRANIAQLMEREFITYQLTKQVKNYYLTTKGKELVKELNNFISTNPIIQ